MTVAFQSALTAANLNAKLISRTTDSTASGVIDFVNGMKVGGLKIEEASACFDFNSFSASGETAIIFPRGTVRPPDVEGAAWFNAASSIFEGYQGGSWQQFIISPTSSHNLEIRSVTGTDTATNADEVLVLSSSAFTQTLFTAVGNEGKVIELLHAGSNFVKYTIATTSGQTVGGYSSGSISLNTNGERLRLISDNSNWLILSHETDTTPVTYSASYTGFGSPTVENLRWHREGAFLCITGRCTVGTPTSTEARISLPGGTSSSSLSAIEIVGSGATNTTNGASRSVLCETSKTYLTFGLSGASGGFIAKVNGDSLVSSGNVFSFFARILMTDWF